MKLEEIKTTHAVLPLRHPIRSAIHHIDAIHVLITEIRGEGGHEGFGVALAFSPHHIQAMDAVVRDVAPLLAERPLDEIGALREAMFQRTNYIGWSGVATQAIGTVDMALWVLLAERARLPLYKLLGATVNRLECYHAQGLWLGQTGQGLADEAKGYVDEGYRAIKLRIGQNDLAADLERVERVRSAIGGGIILMVDANQGQDPLYAYRLGKALEPYDIFWYEEPVAYTDVATHARLAAELRVPIATGQSAYLERGMLEYLQAGACHILMPDVCRMGGITGWRKAAALAEAFHTPVSNHMYLEFGAHLQASIPNRTYVDSIDWLSPLFEKPLKVEDGWVTLPEEPGIGLRLDRKALDRYRAAA
ncbi:MAG: mandelate racemase/muconate lactonizing enzyme family protein [SAR324 cluster bacterium]|nr:mandelate racemase/muconate lactonizing enzyme family protein [SAR324 cluster bacterium]